jgi:pyruvate dehydrogenase E1 component
MASFIAAGTAYSNHGVNTIPFYIYYSMFGFQRIGDQIWPPATCAAKGFLLGGTAGRTTLATAKACSTRTATPLLRAPCPTAAPTTRRIAYELAIVIQDGDGAEGRMYDKPRSSCGREDGSSTT